MVMTDRTPTPPSTTSGSTGARPGGAAGASGSDTKIVPADLIDDLVELLGGQATVLDTDVASALTRAPNPSRFGNAPLARELSARMDSAYADLHAALRDAVTGLRSYRDGFKAYRDGMTGHDADVAARARRQTGSVPALPPPDLSAGDACFDGSRTTVCAPTDAEGER